MRLAYDRELKDMLDAELIEPMGFRESDFPSSERGWVFGTDSV